MDHNGGPAPPGTSGTFFIPNTPPTETPPTTNNSDFPAFDPGHSHSGPYVQPMTGPVGEPGLPPSRPSSTATGATGVSSRAGTRPTASRRGLASFASRGSYHDSSRPQSSASRTHIPNLTSAAFFRPMSSQKLQGQRQPNRPTSPLRSQPIPARKSTETEASRRRHRYSNASIVTIEQNNRGLVDADAPPVPTSRGTATSRADTNVDGSTLRNTATEGSNSPLQHRDGAAYSNGGANIGSASKPKSPKSPHSARTSWGRLNRSNRNLGNGSPRANGHEKLHSTPPSPRLGPQSQSRRNHTSRNYQYFNGNTAFFLHGRLLNTRQKPLNVFTCLLTIIPTALFFGFSAPWLWHHVSPAIPILFAYVFFICMSSFFHASFTDPGIIPRGLHPHPPDPTEQDPLALGPPTTDWVTVRSFGKSTEGPNTAMEVPVKYCKSCGIWRPPRAHHCRVCDSCIETQDHHCVWLNNCVGRRNYRYFYTFVASGTILGCFLLAASLAHILVWMHRNNTSFGAAINQWRVPFAMFIYGILVIPYPGALWGYHLFLTARGESTREYLNSHKFLKKDRHRPFSQQSILKNWASILIRPRPPTYMRFRHRYEEGDQRLGGTKRRSRKQKNQDLEKGDLEMKELNAGSTPGFQGPASRGRGMINSTPRDTNRT